MKIGIIRYPGSNCDMDTKRFFPNSFFIWHNLYTINNLESIDLLVIPGGFAFGDRIYEKATEDYEIQPGKKAIESPVTTIILEAVNKNIPILGICNGFQILIELGLLPGHLVINNTKKFVCKQVSVICDSEKYDMYIANKYGNYVPDNYTKIFLEYETKQKEYNTNVAGVCNESMNIFGMMPHPERNSSDFLYKLCVMMFCNNPKYNLIKSQHYFDKKINELMRSEHISYKTTKRFLKKMHTQEDWVIQGPGENAGIVDIGNGYALACRIESHNHPTFIDPYEGAATGVGGILRDIFTMGAKPIAIMDFLRFGVDDNSKKLLDNAIEGISYYGNCVGVPNIGGDLYCSKSYNKNPLVNVACFGIVKKESIVYGNVENANDLLIYIGSKTGNEGIGGAAMSSKSFSDDADLNILKNNVQKSDPFLEKLLIDACNEITNDKLVVGMQDMGAGGLLCASIEVVTRGIKKFNKNFGCKLFINSIPTKYPMTPCNTLISESQERMLLVAKKENYGRISSILKKWDLEYSIIGKVTIDNMYTICDDEENKNVLYKTNISMFQDIQDYTYNYKKSNKIKEEKVKDTSKKIKDMKKWSVYDSTIGNRTIKGSDKPGSYSILDLYEINKQLFIVWGETFDECYNTISQFEGVKPLGIINCLNYGHPNDSLNSLVEFVETLTEKCRLNKIPILGGNVSLYNSTDSKSIRPTPILVMFGIN